MYVRGIEEISLMAYFGHCMLHTHSPPNVRERTVFVCLFEDPSDAIIQSQLSSLSPLKRLLGDDVNKQPIVVGFRDVIAIYIHMMSG